MTIRYLSLLGVLVIVLRAQKPKTEFDVVSVKPSAPDRYNSFAIRNAPGGRVQLLGAPLRMILMEAYDMQAFQIIGGGDWVRNDRWDIEARAEGTEGRLTRVDRNLMLQSLIADRFHLRAHEESRQAQIYTLEANKRGPKLVEHTGPDQEFRLGPGGSLHVKKGGTGALAAWLSRQLRREVLDKTNLKGEYDYSLEWTPEAGEGGPESIGQPPAILLDAPTSPTDGPSIFTALQNQLGLRLIARKGPVRVLVIDSVEKPDPN
jgi:bla regulator protein blaR1